MSLTLHSPDDRVVCTGFHGGRFGTITTIDPGDSPPRYHIAVHGGGYAFLRCDEVLTEAQLDAFVASHQEDT